MSWPRPFLHQGLQTRREASLCLLLGASSRPSRQKRFSGLYTGLSACPRAGLSPGKDVGGRAGRTTLGLAPTLSLTGMSPVQDGDRGLGGLPSRQPEAWRPPARPEALQAKSGPSPLGTANNGLRLLLPPVHRETKGPSSPRPVPTPDPGHCPEDDERRVFSLFLSPLLF